MTSKDNLTTDRQSGTTDVVALQTEIMTLNYRTFMHNGCKSH